MFGEHLLGRDAAAQAQRTRYSEPQNARSTRPNHSAGALPVAGTIALNPTVIKAQA